MLTGGCADGASQADVFGGFAGAHVDFGCCEAGVVLDDGFHHGFGKTCVLFAEDFQREFAGVFNQAVGDFFDGWGGIHARITSRLKVW